MPHHSAQSQEPCSLHKKNFGFAQIPNVLIDAWLKGIISDPCFKLVTICLRHSESFHVKYNYLHKTCGMHKYTIRKARQEAEARNILKFEKICVNKTRKNKITVLPIAGWNFDALEIDFAPSQVSGSEVNHTHIGSQVSGSEVNHTHIGSLVNGSEVNQLKNTNSKNTNSKKTKEKNTSDDDVLRTSSYELGYSMVEISTVEQKATEWLSKRKPSEIVNELRDLRLLPSRKNGWIDGIQVWNEIAKEVWDGKTDSEIDEDLSRLHKGRFKLRKSVLSIKALLESLSDTKTEIEIDKSNDELPYKSSFVDDCPF